MRRAGPRNGRRDGGRKAQKRCSVLPEPGSGGSEMTSAADEVKKRPARWRPEGARTAKRHTGQTCAADGKTLASNVKRGGEGGNAGQKKRRQEICRRKGHCPALFIGRCRCSHGSVRPRGKAGRCRPCLRQRCGRQRCRPVPMPLRRPRHAAARVSG